MSSDLRSATRSSTAATARRCAASWRASGRRAARCWSCRRAWSACAAASTAGTSATTPALARAAGGDVEILPLCPEVLARLGVPRAAITLSADGKIATDAHGRDVTAELEAGVRLADLLAREAGATRALLKERSPSCGVTEVHGPEGLRPGEGRFAARLRKRGLPVVSERAT